MMCGWVAVGSDAVAAALSQLLFAKAWCAAVPSQLRLSNLRFIQSLLAKPVLSRPACCAA
jgi:hypothetical protein